MKHLPFAALAAALLVCGSTLHAQSPLPQTLNYQGRVVVNGVNFNGTGKFKFALVNADATQTYWSNDGTSTAGSAPTNAVDVTVTNGLYSVLLGKDMGAIPPSVFTKGDVRLRVWFDDSTANGEQLLSPDQSIAPAGYAHAAAGLNLPSTNSAGTEGVILQNGSSLMHNYGTRNFFAGRQSGNFTLNPRDYGFGGAPDNVGIGDNALSALTIGALNVAVGSQALAANTDGPANTAIGNSALAANARGSSNTAVGADALKLNTVNGNTAVGYATLALNTGGVNNTATGLYAMYANTTGPRNTAIGYRALSDNTTGASNVALGEDAGKSISTGSNNIALGAKAGNLLTTGNNNIDIGHAGVAGEANTIRIGTAGSSGIFQSRTFIAGIRGVTTGLSGTVPVIIDSNGQLGTTSSSARYKEDVADMGDASARIQALRPVTFRYTRPYENGEKPIQYGLIAEEVAQSFPELAIYNDQGEPETVKYQDLTPLLLNEVQKLRHEKDQLTQETEAMRARLDKLEALINKPTEAR